MGLKFAPVVGFEVQGVLLVDSASLIQVVYSLISSSVVSIFLLSSSSI